MVLGASKPQPAVFLDQRRTHLERAPLALSHFDVKTFDDPLGRTPPVTDHSALAAHEFWHRRTNGIWSNFLHDENCCTDRGVPVRLSGLLLALSPSQQAAQHGFSWNSYEATQSVGSPNSIEVTIAFIHKLMRISVDFQVVRLSPTRLQVTVVTERRLTADPVDVKRLSPEQANEHQKILSKLNRSVADCEQKVGMVSHMDIIEGSGRFAAAAQGCTAETFLLNAGGRLAHQPPRYSGVPAPKTAFAGPCPPRTCSARRRPMSATAGCRRREW